MLKSAKRGFSPEGAAFAFATIMVSFAIVGVWLHFSPIPYWDMWNGTLGFIVDIRAGQYEKWWAQHNEHRIILSRSLFFLDYELLGGRSLLLIPMNVMIAIVSALMFFLFANRMSEANVPLRKTFMIASILIAGFLFSWTQYENFTWGFQSQFFLAQLLPLISLYFIAKSTETHSTINFCAALIFAIISAGAMANGIAILPIILVFLLVIWQSLIRLTIVLLLAILVIAIYFFDYSAVSHHGSISKALSSDPLGLLYYTFIYIGSPFYHLIGELGGSRNVAALAGLFLVLFCIFMTYQQLKSRERSPYIVALLCFLLYIGATAFGTAGGRLIFGLDGATSSRYATPAIMGWAAFALAMIASFPRPSRYLRNTIWCGAALICILALGYQSKAFASTKERLFSRELGVLALELGIRDEAMIGNFFPSPDYPLAIAEPAKANRLSIFGDYPFEGLSEVQGGTFTAENAAICAGNLDVVFPIDGLKTYIRTRGWLFDPASRTTPKVVTFTDENGLIIGSGLTGQPRPDVANAVDHNASNAGFGGYISPLVSGTRIIAYGDDPLCRLEMVIPG